MLKEHDDAEPLTHIQILPVSGSWSTGNVCARCAKMSHSQWLCVDLTCCEDSHALDG